MSDPVLHILLGDAVGDRKLLERAADHKRAIVWRAPKSAAVGDDAVIHIGGHRLFATAKIATPPKPLRDWPYGAGIKAVRLIKPPISLDVLQQRLPALKWATYPRTITTPRFVIQEKLRVLIRERRARGAADINEYELATASLAELRAAALARSAPRASQRERRRIERKRVAAIKRYALARAAGHCESCSDAAPFHMANGAPYLESHHILRLADEGPDHPRNVIGVCLNCHRRAHFAHDRKRVKARMKRIAATLERGAR